MYLRRRKLTVICLLILTYAFIYFFYKLVFGDRSFGNIITSQDLFGRDEDDVVYDWSDASVFEEEKVPEEDEENNFPYKFFLDEPNTCDSSLQIVNIIPMRADDSKERNGVRRTWGSPEVVSSTGLKPLFLIGDAKSTEEQQNLTKESTEHHDIIQVNIMDTYLNLTLKTLTAIHWKQTRCPQVPWLLKSDADVFMNPWAVSRILKESERDFVCRMLYQKSVCRAISKQCRDKRWVMPREVYSHDKYPPYCNGPAYAISQNGVKKLNEVAAGRKDHFPMEDIYFTGLLAQGLDLTYRNLGGRMILYHLEIPPHALLAEGRGLFVVNSFKKSYGRYTHDDLWDHLRKSKGTPMPEKRLKK